MKQNFSWTFASNVVYSGCRWGMLVLLAKMGSPEMVGQFALGLAVVEPVVMFGNMHLRTVLATDARWENDFRDCLGLRLITSVLALLVVAGIGFISGYEWETALIIILVGLGASIESVSDVFYGLVQQNERMDIIAKSLMMKGPLSLASLGIGTYLSGSLVGGVIGIALTWLLVLVAYDIPCGKAVTKIRALEQEDSQSEASQGRNLVQPRWKLRNLLKLGKLALPLGIVMMLIALNTSIPRYFIEHYFGKRELGIFAAVASLLSVGAVIVLALGQSAYVRLAKHYADGHLRSFLALMLKLLGIAVLLGIAGILIAFVAGQQVLELAFGRAYAQRVDVLLWIMAAAGISYVASFLGYGVTAARYFKSQVPLMVGVVCTVTLASYILVPTEGLRGAAIAVFIAAVVQAIWSGGLLLYCVFKLLKNEQAASDVVPPEKLDSVGIGDDWYDRPLARMGTDLPLQAQAQRVLEQKNNKASEVQVSVIIPTHNRAEFLRSAIRSVLNQTFQEFELIVVDDFSGDHTAEVVRSITDTRVRFIQHKTKKKGAAARNTGIRNAHGKYIAFLDDDDEWLPEKLRLQVDLLDKSPAKVGGVYTAFTQVDKVSGDIIFRKTATKSGNLLHVLHYNNCIGTTSSVLLRRECLEKVGLFDENLQSLQDYDLWIRISREFQFVGIDKPLLIYHVHHRRISTNAEALHQGLRLMLKKHALTVPLLRANFGYAISLEIGTHYCLQNDVQKARQAYLKAIRLYPLGIRAYFGFGLSLFDVAVFKKIRRISNTFNAVNTSGSSVDREVENPPLKLILNLSAALDKKNIRYCHWKSNVALHRSLSGDNDLDLLVDPRYRFQFCRLLSCLGFKQASSPEDLRYPGIFNFYGYDMESGKIVHIHVHYRLIVGCDLIKNYDLPFVNAYLDSAPNGNGLKVPAVEFEYVVFVIRMMLKRRLLAWVLGHPDPRILFQAFSQMGRPGLRGSEAWEWRDFQSRVKRENIIDILAKYLPTVDIKLFERCEGSLQPTERRWEWLMAGAALCSALKSYQRYSTPFAVAHAFYRRAESLLPVMSRYLPFRFSRPRKRRLVAGRRVIAFVGGDGSGKTTNLMALQKWLGNTFDVQTFHLGLPPLGPARILYLLISKGLRVLMGNPPEMEVKPLHAITHILVARGRWKLAKAVSSEASMGTIVLCDRFPLMGLELSEGPLIPCMNNNGSPLISWLAAIEQSYYDKIFGFGLPHDIIVLRVDPQTAIDRKPEENPDFIRPRLQEIWNMNWEAMGNSYVIDTGQPLENVLAEVRNRAWSQLPGWLPHIEVVGHAGAGKTTLMTELLQRGVITSGEVTPADHPIRCLKRFMTLWWAFFSYPFAEWKRMVIEETQFDLQEQRIESRNFHVPVVYDQGPIFGIVWSLFMHNDCSSIRRCSTWHHRQIHRARQILDLVISLEADYSVLRKRINSRPKIHIIKGKSDEEQNRFFCDFDHFFKLSISDKSGGNLFSSIQVRTDDATPSELAEKIIKTIS